MFGEAAARLCNAACLLLGWRPNEFWDSTPAELVLALQPSAVAEGADRATLDALLRRFPDKERS
jgi:uncharacterized phage protein (TIGR02216 family)